MQTGGRARSPATSGRQLRKEAAPCQRRSRVRRAWAARSTNPRIRPITTRAAANRTSVSGSFHSPAIIDALAADRRCGAPDQSSLSPRNACARPHRIIQAGPLFGGGMREDRPHEEDGRRQQQRQCLNGSHDRPSPPRVSVAASLLRRVGDEHARGAESESLGGRACRSGRSASSAPPDEPCHDTRPDRDHEARRRTSYAVNEVAGYGPEQRTKHDGQLHDVHDIPTEQAAFQLAPV